MRKGYILLIVLFLLPGIVVAKRHNLQNHKIITSQNNIIIKQLQDQITQLNDQLTSVQQNSKIMADQVAKLQEENQALQTQDTLQKQLIVLLKKQIAVLMQTQATLDKQLHATFRAKFDDYLFKSQFFNQFMKFVDYQTVLLGLIAIEGLLILLLVLRISYRRKASNKEIAEKVNTQPIKTLNYNCLAGEDVVTAKLDLASAYCAMGDVESAKEVLASVLHEGNEQQKQTANHMLAKMEQ